MGQRPGVTLALLQTKLRPPRKGYMSLLFKEKEMTPLDRIQRALDEMKKAEQAATKGPWLVDMCGDIWTEQETEMQYFGGPEPEETFRSIASARRAPNDPNGIFIAAARTSVPRLRKALDRVVEISDSWDCSCVKERPFKCCGCSMLEEIANLLEGK